MADSLYTVGVGITADTAQAERMIRALNDLSRAMDQTAQHQQRLKTGMQQNAQQMQQGGAVAGYFKGQMAALGAQLLAIVGVVALVNKGIREFGSSISAAARLQDQADLFGDLLKRTDAAKKGFQDLINFTRGAGKIFPQADVLDAANALARLNVEASGIEPTIERFGVAVAIAGGKMEDWAHLLEQVGKGQFIRASSDQMKFFINTLAEIEHVDPSKMKKMLQEMDPSKVRVEWEKFMNFLATKTDEITSETELYRSSVNALDNSWLALKQEFGKPIIDMLSPLFLSWAEKMAGGTTQAGEMGKQVADAIKSIADALSQVDWKEFFDSLASGFHWVAEELKADAAVIKSIQDAIEWMNSHPLGTGTTPATAGQRARAAAGLPGVPEYAPQFVPTTQGAAGGAPSGLSLAPTAGETTLNLAPLPKGSYAQTPFTKPGGGGAGDALKDAGADLKTLIDYWEEYGKIQQYATDAESRHYLSLQNLGKAISALGHPIEDVKKLLPGLTPDEKQIALWLAWEEQTKRSIAEVELKMKMGTATMAETWKATLDKMALDAKTWQQAFSEMTLQIKDALVNDISGGLADILDGTKSLKQGFKDMAISILKDIERIILRQLVEISIQQLLNALRGYSSGAAGAAAGGGNYLGVAGLSQAGGAQQGGVIPGQGSGDHVPILAEPGEFMINKHSAAAIGYDRLERLNKAGGGGAGMVRMGKSRYASGYPSNFDPTYPGYGWGDEARVTDFNDPHGSYTDPSTGRPYVLKAGDIALSPSMLDYFGVQPGPDTYITIDGTRYHVADTNNRYDNNIDFWGSNPYAATERINLSRAFSPAWGKTTGGKGGPLYSGPPAGGWNKYWGQVGSHGAHGGVYQGWDPSTTGGGPIHEAPSGLPFTGGGGDPTMGGATSILGPGGNYVIAPGAYTGPAFPDYIVNGVTFEPNMTPTGPEGWTTTTGPDAGTVVPALPPGAVPVSGGGGGPSIGGPRFTSAGGLPAPGGWGGVYGGGSWGQLPGGLMGRLSFAALRQGRDASLGLGGRGMAVPMFAAASHPGAIRAGLPSFATLAPYLRPHGAFTKPGTSGFSGREPAVAQAGPSFPSRQRQHFGGRIYHSGGVVDSWGEYQSGGTVKAGEGVFTPQQMANLQPAVSSNTQVSIQINDNRTSATTDTRGTGITEQDSREIARLVTQVVDTRIARQKRAGGSLYTPRSG